MENIDVVYDFYGVYILYCINPKFKGRTYIGYTRDPNRRIRQHNRGTWAGGAYTTNKKGPWKMVMIVHGFPNNISALRFEWAWQNPSKTTRLQHVHNLKKIPRKETEFQYKIRILSEMLRVGPWYRLPLVVRWLEKDFVVDFSADFTPPKHIKICEGPVRSYNNKANITEDTNKIYTCSICVRKIDKNVLKCMNTNCNLTAHTVCLADVFLTPGEYVPIEGDCTICGVKLKWGDLIKRMQGFPENFHQNEGNVVDDSENEDELTRDSKDKMFVDNHSSWLVDDDIDLL